METMAVWEIRDGDLWKVLSVRVMEVWKDERDLFEEKRTLWAEESIYKGRQVSRKKTVWL